MRFAGYQPQYFPRLHYFNRMLDADAFGVGDYVQFVRKHQYVSSDGSRKAGKSYQAHAPIKHALGEFLLSVPARGKLMPINQTGIDYSKHWVEKHLVNIEFNYKKAPNFHRFFPEIESILTNRYADVAELNMKTIFWGVTRFVSDDRIQNSDLVLEGVNDLLNTNHPFRLQKIFIDSQSSVPAPEKGKANEWLVALCKFTNADEYVCGGTGLNSYMDLQHFEKAGIKTVAQNWQGIPYRQQYSKIGFLPNMSVIDLIMNEDLETRQKVILG